MSTSRDQNHKRENSLFTIDILPLKLTLWVDSRVEFQLFNNVTRLTIKQRI